MKSRKLFANLTLVAFMMTLLPMAAFAAVPSRYSSSYTIDVTSVPANNTDVATVKVFVADQNNTPVSNVAPIVVTDRDVDTIANHTDYGTGVTDANGEYKATIKSNVRGTAKVAVALPSAAFATVNEQIAAIVAYLNGSTNKTAAELNLVGSVSTLEFTSASVKKIELLPAAAVDANGTTEMKIVAVVTSAETNGAPVSGVNVEFYVNKTGLQFDKTTYVTDAFGKATAKVTTTKSGTYKVTARAGAEETSREYTFNALTAAYAIEKVSGDNQKVATGVDSSKLKVKVTDINGNKVPEANALAQATPEAKTKPDGASVTFTEEWDSTDKYVTYKVNASKPGDYVIRVKLDNGRYVDFNMTVKDFGSVKGLTIEYDKTNLAIGLTPDADNTGAVTAKHVDENGVTKPISANSLTWSSSNPLLATVDTNGVVTVATNDNDKAGSVVITAVDTSKNLYANATIEVGTKPVSVAATVDKATLGVGEKATVTLQLKDANGKNTTFASVGAGVTPVTIVTLQKPTAAAVDTSVASDAASKLVETGSTTFTVTSVAAGDVKLQVIVTDGVTNYVTSVNLKFTAPKQVIGAKAVTMFIGAKGYIQDGSAKVTDVAPFIKDGRTFVAIRPIAEAFGAQIGWNEATQTVTLTRADMTVTIVIGSNAVTVVKDGVASTVTADVAAFIQDGRTVLPFRAVGEAFGATVSYDAVTQSVSYAQ